MKIGTCALLVLMLTLAFVHQGKSYALSGGREGSQGKDDFRLLDELDFKFLIYQDRIVDFGRPEIARRDLRVLMDERAFSEENLKRLFAVLSKGYPEPNFLKIWVITDLEQSRQPGRVETSSDPDLPGFDLHHFATYFRKNESEFFRYNPNPPQKDTKTVVFKGRDPDQK
jgi:hypothetical protein